MIFNLFGKKKADNIEDLIKGFVTGQKILNSVAKAKSLQQLNRNREAQLVLQDAERIATDYATKNPRDKQAQITLALFYKESGQLENASNILSKLLNSSEYKFTEDESLTLGAELQKIKREVPSHRKSEDTDKNFTQVYCCQNCGRLINFITMPCPHCDWAPTTIELMAQSMVLTNPYFKIPALLMIAREVSNNRSVTDIVPNMNQQAQRILSDIRPSVGKLLNLLNDAKYKNHRKFSVIRQCMECGQNILVSNADTCNNCGEPVNWPDILRLMVCIDNILYLFENRIEVSDSEYESELVCLMVAMLNDLLRNQIVPNEQNRQYALHSLKSMKIICDKNKGFVVDLKDIYNLDAYLIKDKMLPDTEVYANFWLNEIPVFVNMMTNGIRL